MNLRRLLQTRYEFFYNARSNIASVNNSIRILQREINCLLEDVATDEELFKHGQLYGEFADYSDSHFAGRRYRTLTRSDHLKRFESSLALHNKGLIPPRLFKEHNEKYEEFLNLIDIYQNMDTDKRRNSDNV